MMDYAEAVNMLSDELAQLCSRGEQRGLTTKEIADELRRCARSIEEEEEREKKKAPEGPFPFKRRS